MISFLSKCITNGRVVTLAALLTGIFAGTIDGATDVCWGEFVCDQRRQSLFYIDGFVIFAAVQTRPAAGFWISATMRVVNSCLLLYVLFCYLLFLLTFALVCIHRVPPGPQSNCLWKFHKVPAFPCWFCVLLLSWYYLYTHLFHNGLDFVMFRYVYECSIHSFCNCSLCFDVCIWMGQKYRKISKTCFFCEISPLLWLIAHICVLLIFFILIILSFW